MLLLIALTFSLMQAFNETLISKKKKPRNLIRILNIILYANKGLKAAENTSDADAVICDIRT